MKRNHADRLGTAAPDDPFLAVKQLSRASFRILILSFLELDFKGHGNYRLSRRPFIGAVCFSKETTLTCLASSSGREALSCIYRPTT